MNDDADFHRREIDLAVHTGRISAGASTRQAWERSFARDAARARADLQSRPTGVHRPFHPDLGEAATEDGPLPASVSLLTAAEREQAAATPTRPPAALGDVLPPETSILTPAQRDRLAAARSAA